MEGTINVARYKETKWDSENKSGTSVCGGGGGARGCRWGVGRGGEERVG